MTKSFIHLPSRASKPRNSGITSIIDNGISTTVFKDTIESFADYIDLVKFGWGTALITPDLNQKIDSLKKKNIRFHFGGSLFEKAVQQDRVDEYVQFCHSHDCDTVEIANGILPISNEEKGHYIRRFAKDFRVLSEVGYKDIGKSEEMSPQQWIQYIQQDLDAGAEKVILESRESGHGGICRSNGELRHGLIRDVLESGLDVTRMIFEAPSKRTQVYLTQKIGPNVNLANIAFNNIAGLETIRLGLRAETLELYENESLKSA